MRLLCLTWLFILIVIINGDEFEKYRPLREQCEKKPSNSECLQIKTKFFDIIKKCQKITTQQQLVLCRGVKDKLCAIFPSICLKPSSSTTKTKAKITTKTTSTIKKISSTTKSKLIKTTTKLTIKPEIIINTNTFPSKLTLTSTIKPVNTQTETLTNEEFVKVPVNPDELRIRGEYCVRHGKEKKCHDLLNNLKNTYSSCSKKKPSTTTKTTPTKPEQLDCHSFQTHLCLAFPKFPPCTKNTSN